MNKKIFIYFLSFMALLSCVYAAMAEDSISTWELLQMTQESLNADWQTNTAYVRGVGRIVRNDAQGLLLSRRAALTDARRGLLSLREKILSSKHKQGVKSSHLSGHVPPLRILSETVSDGLYFVEIEAELSRLISDSGKSYLSNIYNLTFNDKD